MRAFREWLLRLWGSLSPRRSDRDLEEELRLHVEMAEADAHARTGASGARRARVQAGGTAQAMETLRDQRGLPWLDDFVRDLGHGVRLLRRTPVLTTTAILSLALGIGANAVVFSFADALLLRPLPVGEPDSVVTLAATASADSRRAMSFANYRDIREQSRSFDGLVAHQLSTFSFARARDTVRDMRMGALVSDNLFHAFDVQPHAGRLFAAGEGLVPGRDAVVVFGYDFWKNVLNEDRAVVDAIVWINGIAFNVVGVAPEGFTGLEPPLRPAFYVPLAMVDRLRASGAAADSVLTDRAARQFVVHGRLKRDVSRRDAQAELALIWANLARDYPDANANRVLMVRTELEQRILEEPPTAVFIALMLSLVALVLIIASVNVANLLLGRARARSREIAIRVALGVGRSRLLRQLLTESLLLAAVGCAAGLLLASFGIRYLDRLPLPTDLPIVIAMQIDGRVLGFAVLAATVSAVLFGVAPALRSLDVQLVPALKAVEAAQARLGRTIGRHLLVVSQVALSMVLLIATGMLLDGVRKIVTLDPGFRTDSTMLMSLDTTITQYDAAQSRAFYRDLADRVRGLPGVASVALTSAVPLDRGGTIKTILPEGFTPAPGVPHVTVFSAIVDQHYFPTMQSVIVRGRPFAASDTADTRPVAIVNEEFARIHWPNQDAIGRRLALSDARDLSIEVVGVSKTAKYLFIGEAPMPFLYLPFAQHPRPQMTMLVATAGTDANALAAPLREAVRSLDVNQPVFNLRPLSDLYRQRAIGIPLRLLQIVATLGALGLTLALIGLYGVVAYAVTQRTREIGIRMAIGASHGQVLRMVLRHGLHLSGAGVLLGGLASLAVAPLLSAGLVGLGTPNAQTFVIVPVGLVALTLGASAIPARRAARVDPTRALRDE